MRVFKGIHAMAQRELLPRAVLGFLCTTTLRALAQRRPDLAAGAQQDAHELLADCLDGLQEEMSEALGAAWLPP